VSFRGFTVLAVIPARGGSKGIPRKNLVEIAGVSLVGQAARVAASLPWLDLAILSTDDPEIAEEGRKFGLEVPFLRPAELAADTTSSVDMWRHAWLAAEKVWSARFSISVLLEPTSPLRKAEDIEKTVLALIEGDHLAAATVSRTPAHYTPEKTLLVDENGLIRFYLAEGAKHALRQGIPAYYHRNGLCYAVRRETLVLRGSILDEDCIAVVIERPVVNIDDHLDLRVARMLSMD
jgi:CMP-N-acetylneuraminic acid synthetase